MKNLEFKVLMNSEGPFILNEEQILGSSLFKKGDTLYYAKAYVFLEDKNKPQSEWISGIGVYTDSFEPTKEEYKKALFFAFDSILDKINFKGSSSIDFKETAKEGD